MMEILNFERKISNKSSIERIAQKVVQVGIQFDKIGEIDILNEKFQAEVSIEAKWQENIIITKYDPEVHWNPRLFIENSLQETKDQTRYSVEHDVVTNTSTITQRRTVRGVFWERMELHDFPIDIQQLSITLTTYKTDEVLLVEDKEKKYYNARAAKTFIDQQKWRLYRFVEITQHASYDNCSLDNSSISLQDKLCDVPKLCASCYASRRPAYYLWNAYFLIFLNTVVSLNTFAIDSRPANNRLIPTFTLLLTSITFKWVVNRSLPAVGYLTSLDKYEIASIFYLCLISVWHAIAAAFWESKELKTFEHWIVLAFTILFVLLQVVKVAWLLFIFSKLKYYKNKEIQFLLEEKNLMLRKTSKL